MQDVANGETITYSYDSLNRLIGASGAEDPQGSWSQAFSYEGFGNLLSKVGNNAPNVMYWTLNAATNQITSNGAAYDANGNMTAYGPTGQTSTFNYDEANRLASVSVPNVGSSRYLYDLSNQRVFSSATQSVYLYGADGKKLGVWNLTVLTTPICLLS